MFAVLVGFIIREVGDDANGDVSTSINVLALGVTVVIVFIGGLAEYLIDRRTR